MCVLTALNGAKDALVYRERERGSEWTDWTEWNPCMFHFTSHNTMSLSLLWTSRSPWLSHLSCFSLSYPILSFPRSISGGVHATLAKPPNTPSSAGGAVNAAVPLLGQTIHHLYGSFLYAYIHAHQPGHRFELWHVLYISYLCHRLHVPHLG